MKKIKVTAYIRRLCCLGLSKEVMIPELLRALHGIIPSADNLFTGFDANMQPAYILADQLVPEALEVYLNEPARLFTPEYSARMVEWFATHRVLPDFRLVEEQFYRRDFYNLVLRPYHHHHVIQGMVLENGRCAGFIVLCRPHSQPPFETSHLHQLEQVLPYLDHGMQMARQADQDYVNSGKTGLVILKRDGAMVSLSNSARGLLFLATYGVVPGGQVRFTREVVMPPALRQVCARLDRIFQNRDAPPPVCIQVNPSGRFVFRAYWLESPVPACGEAALSDSSAPDALIGVVIEQHEPLRLRLHRNLQGTRLSIREQDVCLTLVDNLSYPAVATRLHLSPPTVATYIRRIHEKMGTTSREELLNKLLSLEPGLSQY